MSTNKDIRLGMVIAEIKSEELRRRIEKKTGMEISTQYFSKTLSGKYRSEKAQRILRVAREILAEINGR